MAYQPFEAIKQKRLFGVEGMASMKKEEARRAVLSEYDRWAKNTPTTPA
jgi:hypothetical protein